MVDGQKMAQNINTSLLDHVLEQPAPLSLSYTRTHHTPTINFPEQNLPKLSKKMSRRTQ